MPEGEPNLKACGCLILAFLVLFFGILAFLDWIGFTDFYYDLWGL